MKIEQKTIQGLKDLRLQYRDLLTQCHVYCAIHAHNKNSRKKLKKFASIYEMLTRELQRIRMLKYDENRRIKKRSAQEFCDEIPFSDTQFIEE